MRRIFWLTVGAGLGGWAVHKAHAKLDEAKRALTPESVAARLADRATELAGDVGTGLRGFADDVRSGAAEREAELNQRLGRTAAPEPAPAAAPAPPAAAERAVPAPGYHPGRRMTDDETFPPKRGRARTRRGMGRTYYRKDDH